MSDTEVWLYRSTEEKQIVISFRGTASPKDMLTDMALDLAAFDPAGKKDSRSPDEVADNMSEEEMENGPLGGLYKGMKVRLRNLLIKTLPSYAELKHKLQDFSAGSNLLP